MQYEKLDITNLAVIIMLGVTLIMTVIFKMDQLATIIASGLIGHIGRAVKGIANKDKGANKNE